MLTDRVPVVDHRAGQQDADAAGERTEHREPPGPAMDGFHRCVEAIVQRQNSAARSAPVPRSTICSSRDLRRDGRPRVSFPRASRTAAWNRIGTRSTACGTGCRTGCRSGSRRRRSSPGAEDPEGHGLAEAAHQDGSDDAEHEDEPDGGEEGPGYVGPHAERARAPVHADPPQQQRALVRGEPAMSHHPPSLERRHVQTRSRRRRLERQPEQLSQELPAGSSAPGPACSGR